MPEEARWDWISCLFFQLNLNLQWTVPASMDADYSRGTSLQFQYTWVQWKTLVQRMGRIFLTVLGRCSVSPWGNSLLYLKVAFEVGKMLYIKTYWDTESMIKSTELWLVNPEYWSGLMDFLGNRMMKIFLPENYGDCYGNQHIQIKKILYRTCILLSMKKQ